MRILLSRSSADLYALIERLRKAGIDAAGGANLGPLQQAILFRRPEDTDQAIALLKKMGIDAQRG
jgi:hypothetical protein